MGSSVILAHFTWTAQTGQRCTIGKVRIPISYDIPSLMFLPVASEAACFDAWVRDTAKDVQHKALERQRERGWDAVRPALALTVRCVIPLRFLYVRLTCHIFNYVPQRLDHARLSGRIGADETSICSPLFWSRHYSLGMGSRDMERCLQRRPRRYLHLNVYQRSS